MKNLRLFLATIWLLALPGIALGADNLTMLVGEGKKKIEEYKKQITEQSNKEFQQLKQKMEDERKSLQETAKQQIEEKKKELEQLKQKFETERKAFQEKTKQQLDEKKKELLEAGKTQLEKMKQELSGSKK